VLAPKYDDYRQLLALAHYSLRLSSYFVFEQCFAYLIKDHFMVKMSTEPIQAKDIYENGNRLADIFRSEHILIDTLTMETF
jgi:hypothetical protein